ncbi:MAG: hypothetical protein OEN01_06055 [Candidatus Krumholzibacteria bacterium]|nr:hypothetical protein [Candidatus Krumholzibacteria bacterium]
MIGIGSVLQAFYETLRLVGRFKIWLPLLIYALIKLGVMWVYLASVPGPATSVWSMLLEGDSRDSISHYPWNLFLMPLVLSRLGIALEVFVNVVFQGAVILLLVDTYRDKTLSVRSALRRTSSRYPHLMAAAFVSSLALYLATLLPGYVARLVSVDIPGTVMQAGTLVAGLVVQALFVFAMPFVLLSSQPVLRAIRKSLSVTAQSFFAVFLLVLLPFLVTLPTLYLMLKSRTLVTRLSPEIMIHLQISTEMTQTVATFLLLGALTWVFVRRIQVDEISRR